MLKVVDLYRQQLRVHAWRFMRGMLPPNQSAMLGRVGDLHGYGTRLARDGISVSTRDHGSVGYRVPGEWALLTGELRAVASLGGFKRRSRAGFLAEYGAMVCRMRDYYVCRGSGEVGGMQRGQQEGTGVA